MLTDCDHQLAAQQADIWANAVSVTALSYPPSSSYPEYSVMEGYRFVSYARHHQRLCFLSAKRNGASNVLSHRCVANDATSQAQICYCAFEQLQVCLALTDCLVDQAY